MAQVDIYESGSCDRYVQGFRGPPVRYPSSHKDVMRIRPG